MGTAGSFDLGTTAHELGWPAEPPVHLLVALPQSGRTAWLVQHATRAAGPDPHGPPPLWVRGDRRAPVPHGVDDLDLAALLELDPHDVAGRTIAVDDLHLHPPGAMDRLAGHLDAAVAAGAVLLATSVTVPTWPTADWARRRSVRWSGQEELRLDVQTYARALAPFGILARHARLLHQRLDGWAGPIAAAALRSRRGPDAITTSELARRAIDRADDVLRPLVEAGGPPPPGTSLLPSLVRPLVEHALGQEVADAALRTVRSFAPPVGEEDDPIRPHPVLRRILDRAAPAGQATEAIRERALAWYLAHDRFADAIQLLTEADRPADALEIISAHQVDLLHQEGPRAQQRLMDALPRYSWSGEDHLAYVAACIAAGDHRTAGFELSSRSLAGAELPAAHAIARDLAIAYLGVLSHPPGLCIDAARRALRQLDRLPDGSALPHLLGVDDPRLYRVAALTHLARNQIVLGHWDEALETLEGAGPCGHPLLDHGAHGFRAWAHGLRGDAEEAQRCAALAMSAVDFWPDLEVTAFEPRLARAEIHLLGGRSGAARDLALEALAAATATGSEHQRACALVVIAEAELRNGQPLHARATLDRIRDGAYGFVGRRADAIRARLLLASGEDGEARTILRRLALTQDTLLAHALGIAHDASPIAPERIERWVEPPWPSAVLAHRDACSVLSATVEGRVRPSTPRPTSPVGRSRYVAVARVATMHDLSTRESEILLALVSDAPLAEVASGLYISRNTLKTHLRRMYRKLAVHSRHEAIQLVGRAELEAG